MRDLPPDRLALEKHVAATLGYELDTAAPNALEAAVLRFEDPIGFYLNRSVIARRRLPPERVKEAIRDWLRKRRGVRAAYTNTEVGNGLPATEPLALAIARSFRADRSADVLVYLAPGWIFRGASIALFGVVVLGMRPVVTLPADMADAGVPRQRAPALTLAVMVCPFLYRFASSNSIFIS